MANIDLMNHWVESSDRDFEVMHSLFERNHFTYSLFFGHLLLEKLFKSLFAKIYTKSPEAPKIHNLVRLAELCGIELDSEMEAKLLLYNTFNTEARYEDEKTDFYKLCTKEFTAKQIDSIKETRKWLKEKLTEESSK